MPKPVNKKKVVDDDDEIEERPRKKKVVEDDEEEERPKKRRRETDDEEDDEPRKKQSQGWGAVVKNRDANEARREEFENKPFDFWLSKSGDSANIQFLDNEPYVYDAHSIQVNGDWKSVPCQLVRQKHCTFCREGVKRSYRAAFKVLDLRGKWDKDKGKFVPTTKIDKSQEKTWSVNGTTAEALLAFQEKQKSKGKKLTDLVLEVVKSGSGKKSSYNVAIAFDDEENRILPVKYTPVLKDAEETYQPMSDEAANKLGFTKGDND